ncbi:Crp/Fnr family transcriptional regulator [Novosphingobium sp.]|uniref:Crp/Fnr family transcriptional regulator n=1 Tax=Novosphingobium sp. TaxID=1874826 RepID=UPI0035B1145B
MSDNLQFNPSGRTILSPSLIEALTAEQRQRLQAAGVTRSFADGQTIQHRGDEGRGFWLINSGNVRVGQFDAGGEFNAIAMLGAGTSYGELAMLARRPRVVDALAVGPVRATWIAAHRLEAEIADDPSTARRVIGTIALQLQEMIELVAMLRRSRGVERVAQVLAVLSGSAPLPCRVAITQQGLADLVGTSRMTVSVTLTRLEGLGLVRRCYGAIEVLDRSGLHDAARFDEA